MAQDSLVGAGSTEVPSGKPGIRIPTILLVLSMFCTGAAGLVAEFILGTVSTYILGNSIEQFSIIIALMLLTMGIASFMQRFIDDNRLIEKFIFIEILSALLIGFAPIAIYAAFGVMDSHFSLVQYFFVTAIAFLIGLEIPIVLRINQRYVGSLGVNISHIYAADYIGSFVGAFVWVYVLLQRFPLTEISFMIAGLNFLVAIVTFGYFAKQNLVSSKLLIVAAIIVTSSALVYGFTHNREWNVVLEQRLYDEPIVFEQTTKYQRLIVTHNSSTDEYRFFINGNVQFASSDEEIYHEQLVHPVMALAPSRSRVLILGGGDGLALREVLKYEDVHNVTLVDLDPDVVRAFSTHPILTQLNENVFNDARVHVVTSTAISSSGERTPIYQDTGKLDENGLSIVEIIARVDVLHVDADKFLGETGDRWDVVIIDLPDPSSIELAKLYSKEFYLKLRSVLAPWGMVAIQATSPYYAKESFLVIRRTLEAAGFNVIPYHDNVPSFGEWGWMLIWNNDIPQKFVLERISNLSSFEVETRYLTPDVFRGATIFPKEWLHSPNQDISTLMYPKVLHYYLKESWKIE